MTLAGTRPPTVDEWDKYELHHRARLATKPGLTGMWQVSGRSNITDLKEYLNRNKNNYFKSAIEIRIKCNDRTSLDARQFEILNEYIGKM